MKYLRVLMMGSLAFMAAACANLSHTNAGKGVEDDYILVGDPGSFVQLRLYVNGDFELFNPVDEVYMVGLWKKKDDRLRLELTEFLGGEFADDLVEFKIKGDRLISVEENEGRDFYYSRCSFGSGRSTQEVMGSYILREDFLKRFAQLRLHANGTFEKYFRAALETNSEWGDIPFFYESSGAWEREGDRLVLAEKRRSDMDMELIDGKVELEVQGGQLVWMDSGFGRIEFSRCFPGKS